VVRVSYYTALALVAGIAVFGAATATATNFGSTGSPGTTGTVNGVWKTTGSVWTVARRDLTTTYSTAIANSVSNDYNPTDLTAATVTPTTCSAASGHDTCVYDSNYGDNGLNGWNACAGTTNGSHPNQTCTVQWVRINQLYSPSANFIACHELGHSVGLRHTTNASSCMLDGGTSVLTSHDVAHVNAAY
jgi:Dual-action HEIGH metallo-peptidase